jgi:hypothetical protein
MVWSCPLRMSQDGSVMIFQNAPSGNTTKDSSVSYQMRHLGIGPRWLSGTGWDEADLGKSGIRTYTVSNIKKCRIKCRRLLNQIAALLNRLEFFSLGAPNVWHNPDTMFALSHIKVSGGFHSEQDRAKLAALIGVVSFLFRRKMEMNLLAISLSHKEASVGMSAGSTTTPKRERTKYFWIKPSKATSGGSYCSGRYIILMMAMPVAASFMPLWLIIWTLWWNC